MFLVWRRQGIQQGLYFQHNDYEDYLEVSSRIEGGYDLQSYIMEEPAEEVKILIHHILNRYKFYRLEITQYFEILDLLRQPRTEDARMIQQSVFRGVVAFNNLNKDRVGPALQNPAFQGISLETKTLMHKILHQFHFLNCIRAYEMFQQRFRQPATTSQNSQQFNQAPFDDELEKARLHYMYYGPYSVYHINNLSAQQPINMPFQQQSYYPVPANQVFALDPFPHRSEPYQDTSFLMKQLQPKLSQDKEQIINRSYEAQKINVSTRGRPPKYKKKMLERISQRRISSPLRKILQKNHKQIQILQERDEIFQYCVCRGFLRIQDYFCCQRCGKYYHPTCLGRNDVCIGCNMKIQDNFNKVNDTIGMYFLDWWDEFHFQELFNMKRYEKICNTGRFQIMISCSLPNSKYPVWPDGAILKINGEPVFQISPLLKAHQIRQRSEGVCFITPYIFDEGYNGGNLEKIKIQLQAVVNGNEYRDNRRNTFFLGIFLVQKASVQRLTQEVLEYNRSTPAVNPVQAGFFIDQYYEIDRLAVSCADPYSKQMIETPVRGQDCKHLGCFDLQTFLVFQERSQKRNWLCPFCKKDARILIVDKYQLRIMEQIRDISKFPGKIIYFSDGSIDFQDGADANSNEDESSSHS